MTSLAHLQAQRDALIDTIAALQKAERSDAIAAARKIMAEHGLTIADLKPAPADKGAKLPPARRRG